jgi:ABC-type antimicrobial peptide transport system permease subunit
MALGAAPGRIVRLILGRALTLTGLGVTLGTLAGLWVSGLVSSLLFGLGARDVGTFCTAGAVLMTLGLTAAWLPARRAAATDPAATLRLT